MILALLLVQAEPLPEYAVSIRCAALAETAHAQAKEAAKVRTYYDALIFWGLAASERARKDGITAVTFTEDQVKAGAIAKADFAGNGAGAADELAKCLAKVPNLK